MPIVLDGGLATTLQDRGLARDAPVENLDDDRLIEEVHRAFAEAGAEILLAASFRSLPSVRIDWKMQIERALRVARAASGGRTQVWLSLGPGSGHGQAVCHAMAQPSGVDGVVLETFVDPGELRAAVREVREVYAGTVVASVVPDADGSLRDGSDPADLWEQLHAAGASGLGFNCMPSAAIRAAVARVPDGVPVWAKPNRGPSPEDLPALAARCTWLGGCCGTTPEAIRALAEQLRP